MQSASVLSLHDMKRNAIGLDVLNNFSYHGDRKQKLKFLNGLLVHVWKREDLETSLFTISELRKLHRSFGHPTVSSLSNILSKARPDEMNVHVREALEQITKY